MTTQKPPSFLPTIVVACVALAIGSTRAQLVVTNTANYEFDEETGQRIGSAPGSLRHAIENVPDGGTITFDPSLSGGTIPLGGNRLVVDRAMTIDASGLPAAEGGSVGISITNVDRVAFDFGEPIEIFDIVMSVGPAATGVVLKNLRLSGGRAASTPTRAPSGAGIRNSGSLTLEDCEISGNRMKESIHYFLESYSGGSAGGISNSGTLVMNRCSVLNNTAGHGSDELLGGEGGNGGGIVNSGTLVMSHCVVSGNSAGKGGYRYRLFGLENGGLDGGSGGGIYNTGDLTLDHCSISSNEAGAGGLFGGSGGSGGGIYQRGGTIRITNSQILDNRSGAGADNIDNDIWDDRAPGFYTGRGGDGGGIYQNAGTTTLEDSIISGNSAGQGGAGSSFGGQGGARGGSGGGIWARAELQLARSSVVENQTGAGGAGSPGSTWVEDGQVLETYRGGSGGLGGNGGGLVVAPSAQVSLEDSLFSANRTGSGGQGGSVEGSGGDGGNGGGVWVESDLIATACSFARNHTGSGGGGGAALPLTAPGDGGHGGSGAAVFAIRGTLDFTNCTLARNRTGLGASGGADDDGGENGTPGDGGAGGALSVSESRWPTVITLRHCTLTENESAHSAGGIAKSRGMLALFNSVIAHNVSAAGAGDLAGAIDTSLGINLIGDPTGASGLGADDLVGLDPMLAPLGNYGGETPTLLPLPGSPLIDAAPDSDQAEDQRGLPRSLADIGAVEFQAGDDALIWVLDADADGSPFGVEQAVGTDPALADRGSSANPQFSVAGGASVLTFGRNPGAQPGTVWRVTRSIDLALFEEIYRFDGTTEIASDGVTSDLGAATITVTDGSPPTGTAAYRLEVLRAGP